MGQKRVKHNEPIKLSVQPVALTDCNRLNWCLDWLNPFLRLVDVKKGLGCVDEACVSSKNAETLGTPRVPLKTHCGSNTPSKKYPKVAQKLVPKPISKHTTKEFDNKQKKDSMCIPHEGVKRWIPSMIKNMCYKVKMEGLQSPYYYFFSSFSLKI